MSWMSEKFWKTANEILKRVSAQMQAYDLNAGTSTQRRQIREMEESMIYLDGYVEAYRDLGILSDWDYEDIDYACEEAMEEFLDWADEVYYFSHIKW